MLDIPLTRTITQERLIIDTATSALIPNDISVRHTRLAANTTTMVSYVPDCARSTLTIPLDQGLRFLHFGKQVGVSNDSSRIPDFSTSLVQPRNDPYDRTFRYIRQLDDFGERLRPLASSTILDPS
jgi:hypothetical protein